VSVKPGQDHRAMSGRPPFRAVVQGFKKVLCVTLRTTGQRENPAFSLLAGFSVYISSVMQVVSLPTVAHFLTTGRTVLTSD